MENRNFAVYTVGQENMKTKILKLKQRLTKEEFKLYIKEFTPPYYPKGDINVMFQMFVEYKDDGGYVEISCGPDYALEDTVQKMINHLNRSSIEIESQFFKPNMSTLI